MSEFRIEDGRAPTLKINNFKTDLKEILFNEAVKIDNETDTLIEVYLEKADSQLELFGMFNSISYLSSINYSLNIRIYYFGKNPYTQSEKLNLREIINLFIADGFYKFQANYFESKVNLADLKIICDYIIFKIKNANLVNLMHEDPLFSRKSVNNTADLAKKTDLISLLMENKVTTTILLHTAAFTISPLRRILIYYNTKKGVINIKVYHISISSSIELNFKIKSIMKHFPFIQQMLDAKIYREVGKRVFTIYKDFLTLYVKCREIVHK